MFVIREPEFDNVPSKYINPSPDNVSLSLLIPCFHGYQDGGLEIEERFSKFIIVYTSVAFHSIAIVEDKELVTATATEGNVFRSVHLFTGGLPTRWGSAYYGGLPSSGVRMGESAS